MNGPVFAIEKIFHLVGKIKLGGDVIVALAPGRNESFAEWAAEILGADQPPKTLGALLIQRGYTLTREKVGNLAASSQGIHNTVVSIDGAANFYFLEHEDGHVSVCSISRRYNGLWQANDFALEDPREIIPPTRLLLRNFDASKL